MSSCRLGSQSTKQGGRERQGSEGAAEVSSADDVCEAAASTPDRESTPSLAALSEKHMEHQGNPKEDCLSLLLWPLSSRNHLDRSHDIPGTLRVPSAASPISLPNFVSYWPLGFL